MYEMTKGCVEIFRLLSLNLVLLLHRNQKLSFRSKGHHGKVGNCSRVESDLHFTTFLKSSGYELVQSLRWQGSQCFRILQQHCEAPVLNMRGLMEYSI